MTRDAVRALFGALDPELMRPVLQDESDSVEWRGVQRRRVVLVAPGQRVIPTILLSPVGDGPWPAAVAIHQHNGEFHLGKSEPAGMAGDPGLAYGLELARLGVVVAIPDLAGFEERRGPFQHDADYERFEAWRAVAEGASHAGRHLDDLSVVVSWLLDRTGAPGGRVGVVGQSLGGQLAFFAMACDARIRAGVLSCGVGTVASFLGAHVLHNPAWYPPGIVSFGDSVAIARAFDDQDVLVTAGREDPIFPYWAVEQVMEAFPGAAELRPFDGGHAFPPAVRHEALAWLAEGLRLPGTRGG